MAIATTSIAAGKIAATKIAARKTKELVVKEVKKRAKKEIVKRTVGKVADASESENLAKIAKPVAKELSELKSGKLNPKELPAMKTDVFKNGPKDIQFDLNKDPQGLEYRIFDESKFLSGTDKVVGRKPTPDSLLVDTIRKEALFVRDIRPSECASGSWLMPLDNDRMREFRDAMAHEFEEHTLTREDAEARIIVREHDLKMDCRPERWRNPDGVPADFQEKLLIRIPSDQTDRIDALLKTLTESGRSPEVIESRGVTSIKYNIEKPTWESKEVGEENGKKVYELNAGKNADGTRNPERVLLNQHPLPANSVFKVHMADGVTATFETDDKGRVVSAKVDKVKIVDSNKRLRDSNRTIETKNIKDGKLDDDGGHLIGDLFGGSSDQINLVPMNADTNEVASGSEVTGDASYREVEKTIAEAVEEGKEVTDLKVDVIYEGDSSRPVGFVVSVKIDGVDHVYPITND